MKHLTSPQDASGSRVAPPVTLPTVPGVEITSARPETDPIGPPIKVVNVVLNPFGLAVRKLVNYAEAVEWECTIAEAAEAIGISQKNAKRSASRYGILHRFKGFSSARSKAAEGVNGSASDGHIAAMRRGVRFDENQIPLDALFRGRDE